MPSPTCALSIGSEHLLYSDLEFSKLWFFLSIWMVKLALSFVWPHPHSYIYVVLLVSLMYLYCLVLAICSLFSFSVLSAFSILNFSLFSHVKHLVGSLAILSFPRVSPFCKAQLQQKLRLVLICFIRPPTNPEWGLNFNFNHCYNYNLNYNYIIKLNLRFA